MAKPDWGELQQRFLSDHAKSGISPKEWCEEQGLNYTSARRYIKKPTAQKTAQRKLRTAQAEKSAEKLVANEALTKQQRNFVAEYLKDGNATQAAIRAGYSVKSAEQIGYQLLQKTPVAQEIAQQQKASAQRTLIEADDVLEKMWQLATFDANELAEYRRGCCRRCWGVDHKYQWTEDEYNAAVEKAELRDKPIPDNSGGMDYNPTREPYPDCPHCGGEGIGRVFLHDTRNLSPLARLAYSGVKIGKGTIEMTSISREKMLENVARHLGLFDSKNARRLQELEMERRELDNGAAKKQSGQHSGPEDDYKLQALTPDEPLPENPIL
ncbi:terminase small subunit [Martelella alba]|uniref:Terminase small subunit n=1 Tax=Martelella alba TaxID=2590451 RepID=A0ABY2SFQ9_9HYPH|nr:terminase small subunit [Martelella alba]TKI03566.1 terminase small subunit [Martelella alba]